MKVKAAVTHYIGTDLAYLLDLNDGAFITYPQPAIDRALLICGYPGHADKAAREDAVRFLDPCLHGSLYLEGLRNPQVFPRADLFMRVVMYHGCPEHSGEWLDNGNRPVTPPLAPGQPS